MSNVTKWSVFQNLVTRTIIQNYDYEESLRQLCLEHNRRAKATSIMPA